MNEERELRALQIAELEEFDMSFHSDSFYFEDEEIEGMEDGELEDFITTKIFSSYDMLMKIFFRISDEQLNGFLFHITIDTNHIILKECLSDQVQYFQFVNREPIDALQLAILEYHKIKKI